MMSTSSGETQLKSFAPRVAMIVLNPCIIDARVIKTAESIAGAGYDVRVFCTLSNDGVTPAYEVKNNVTYIRLTWKPRLFLHEFFPKWVTNNKIASYILRLISGGIFPYLKYYMASRIFSPSLREFRPHMIHAHDLVPLPFASKVAREIGAKVIYDAHELEVHRSPPLPYMQRMLVKGIEKNYGGRADAVITVGDMISEILKRELHRDDVHVVYNAPSLKTRSGLSNVRKDCGLGPHQQILVYVGKVTSNRGIASVLEALQYIPGLHFAVVGPCDEREKKETIALADRLKVRDYFHLLPPVDFSDVVQYISTADMGIISIVPLSKSYELSMPNKLFEMSFARIPIVAVDLPEIGKFIRRYRNGHLYQPGNPRITVNPETLAATITYALSKKHELRVADEAYEDMILRYSWIAQEQKLIDIYHHLVPLAHDPEKWEPVFGKDHAQAKC